MLDFQLVRSSVRVFIERSNEFCVVFAENYAVSVGLNKKKGKIQSFNSFYWDFIVEIKDHAL